MHSLKQADKTRRDLVSVSVLEHVKAHLIASNLIKNQKNLWIFTLRVTFNGCGATGRDLESASLIAKNAHLIALNLIF